MKHAQTMVNDALVLSSKKQRSYSGCGRCKRRRQKCDEQKPHCGRCTEAGISCEYSVQLRWGGRAFDRSRFGVCLKGDVQRIENTTDGFVYAASVKISSPLENMFHSLPTELQPFPSLSATERSLLHHYTHQAARITCCSSHVQTELCQLVLPMVLKSPSLLYATLAWAAIHNVTCGGNLDVASDPDRFIASLKAKSIENLRLELQCQDIAHRDALLATVRTLCQCEIHSGSDGSSAWRVHVKGAKALMAAVKSSTPIGDPQPRLLYRWYASLESLAALTSSGQTLIETVETIGSMDEGNPEFVYLDDYNGCSTDLSLIIGNIGAAIEAYRSNEAPPIAGENLETLADSLERSVYHIMERDNTQNPVFYPGVAEKLSPLEILEYSLCNQAYQYTALIHIQRRLRNLPSNTPLIQYSVRRIIECASGITPAYGLSPATVLTTPLFTAGCEALGGDRDVIRELLKQLFEMLKIRNIKLALEVLENLWAGEHSDGDWVSLLKQKNWDFIPY